MNTLLRRFVELIEADLTAVGFIRRGPVFRYFDAENNGIALDIQRTTALRGQVEFYVNVGVLLAPHLRYYFGDGDPRSDAMPHHSIWSHRLVATDDTAELPDRTFSLSTDADVTRAATIVQTWLAQNLPRMKSWLGNFDAMLSAVEQHGEQYERAYAEQLASGRWKESLRPDGIWNESIVRLFAYAERGDVDAVVAETASWHDDGPDELAGDALAIARQRLAERKG